MATGKRPAAGSGGSTPNKKAKRENLMWKLSVLQAKHGLVSESKVGKKAKKALTRGGVKSADGVNEEAAAQIKELEDTILQKKTYHRKVVIEKALSKARAAEVQRLEGRVASLKEEVKKSGGNVNVVSETQPGARRTAKEKKLCAAAKELAAAKDVDEAELFDVVLSTFRKRKLAKEAPNDGDAAAEDTGNQVDVNICKLAARMAVLPPVKSACGDYEDTIETMRERMAAKVKEVKEVKDKAKKSKGQNDGHSENSSSDSNSDSDGSGGSDSSDESGSDSEAKQATGLKKERNGRGGKGPSKEKSRNSAPTWLGKSEVVEQANKVDVAAHPSWVAKKKQVNVAEFAGSKVTFGDSDSDSDEESGGKDAAKDGPMSKPKPAPKRPTTKAEKQDPQSKTKILKGQEQRGQGNRRNEDRNSRQGTRGGRDGRNMKNDKVPAGRAPAGRAPTRTTQVAAPKTADSIPEHFHPSYVEKKKRELELKKLMESAKPTKITFGDDSD